MHDWFCVCLLVLLLERVLGSYDRKGHLCPSGSRVHWALAEKRVGLHSSSPAGWYPVCAPACVPSVCHSVDWRQLSNPILCFVFLFLLLVLHARLPLIIFAFLFLKQVNTRHLPHLTRLSWKCSSHRHNDKSAYKLPWEGMPLASHRKQWIVSDNRGCSKPPEARKLLWAQLCNRLPLEANCFGWAQYPGNGDG